MPGLSPQSLRLWLGRDWVEWMSRCGVILTNRKESEDPESFLQSRSLPEVFRDEVNFLQVKKEVEETAQSIEGQKYNVPMGNR